MFITSYYGLETLGFLAFFQALTYLINVFIKFGFTQSIYQLKSNNDTRLRLNIYVFQIWSFIAFLLVILMGLFIFYIFKTYYENFFLASFLALITSWISIESNFRLPDNNPIKALALEDLLPGFLFFAMLIGNYFFDFHENLLSIYFFSFLPSFLVVIFLRISDLNNESLFYSTKLLLQILRKNFNFFLLSLSQLGHSHGAIILLSLIATNEELGAFRFALALLALCSTVSTSFATEAQRKASISDDENNIKKTFTKFARINFCLYAFSFSLLLIIYLNFEIFSILKLSQFLLSMCLVLFSINLIKSIFGFPDPYLISREYEESISILFIVVTFLVYLLAMILFSLNLTNVLIITGILSSAQLISVMFYENLLIRKFNIRSDIFTGYK